MTADLEARILQVRSQIWARGNVPEGTDRSIAYAALILDWFYVSPDGEEKESVRAWWRGARDKLRIDSAVRRVIDRRLRVEIRRTK